MPYMIKKKTFSSTSTVGMFDPRLRESGIPLNVHGERVCLSPQDQHCMVIGSSGRGKTRRALYPSVVLSARAGHSMIILDPKGELYRNTAEEVRRCGHDIRVLNLRNPDCGDRWSPLTLVQQYWTEGRKSHATILLKDIAELVTADISSVRDGYWKQAATDTIIGFSLLLLERGKMLTFDRIQRLVNEFFQGDNEDRDSFRNSLDPSADSYRRICTLTNLDTDVTLSCVVSETNSSISRFCDQRDVRDLLLGGDYDLTEIGRKPTAYYLIVPDDSTALHPLAALFISQSYSELIHYADSSESNTLPVRVDYIIDEFGSVPTSDWCAKLTAARSRGIRFVLALQTFDQLIARFGEHGAYTILSNCRTIEYLGGKDLRMMKLFENLSGRTIDRNGYEHPKLSIEDMAGMEMGQTIILDDSGKPRQGYLPEWKTWMVTAKADLSSTRRGFLPEEPISIGEFISDPFSSGSSGGNGIDISKLSASERIDLLNQLCPPPTKEEQELLARLFPQQEENLRQSIDEFEKTKSDPMDPEIVNFDDNDELPF